MTNIKKHLGSNIKFYRTSRGISQAKLAEKVDMATNYLGLVEKNKKYPSAEMVERIAVSLGIDSTDLFVSSHIEENWKEIILSKMETLINTELKTLRRKKK
jgi:transcriptional regulator with XRE-family HTH domain